MKLGAGFSCRQWSITWWKCEPLPCISCQGAPNTVTTYAHRGTTIGARLLQSGYGPYVLVMATGLYGVTVTILADGPRTSWPDVLLRYALRPQTFLVLVDWLRRKVWRMGLRL